MTFFLTLMKKALNMSSLKVGVVVAETLLLKAHEIASLVLLKMVCRAKKKKFYLNLNY